MILWYSTEERHSSVGSSPSLCHTLNFARPWATIVFPNQTCGLWFTGNSVIEDFRGDNQQLMILDVLFFACCFLGVEPPKVGTSLPGQPFQVESGDGFESHVLLGLGTHWPERSGTHRGLQVALWFHTLVVVCCCCWCSCCCWWSICWC